MWNSLFDVAHRGLPVPDALARMQGEAVAQSIASRMTESGSQSLSFADFMRACLYEPGLGYYTAGSTKLGQAGDFTTAPELSPLFGATLAQAFAPLTSLGVLELGAGSGALAASFLNQQPGVAYNILEVSADLRARQQSALHGNNVCWLDALPDTIEGVVLLNEVLDAVPCELIRFSETGYEQGRVVLEGDAFVLRWVPLLDDVLLNAAKRRVPPIAGYVTEINVEAEALAATLAAKLSKTKPAAICFIDYGFPGREFYMPSRTNGTLMCHFRHRAHSDPLVLTGLQDITSHIDFTAVAEACVDVSASVICYATQAKFLLHAGLLSALERVNFADENARIAALGKVQKLISPTEMGELFKVLVVGNTMAADVLNPLSNVDECYRL